jgi:IclR family acetate operon transcriptional repressor
VVDVAPTKHIVQAVATIGTLLPLHASAGGKAMLAAGDGMHDLALCQPLAKFTGNTVIDVTTMAAELELIRQHGWARQISEFESGVSSAAAAIPRTKGPTAAIVLFGPANRLTDEMIERVAPLVIHAADEVAHRLR